MRKISITCSTWVWSPDRGLAVVVQAGMVTFDGRSRAEQTKETVNIGVQRRSLACEGGTVARKGRNLVRSRETMFDACEGLERNQSRCGRKVACDQAMRRRVSFGLGNDGHLRRWIAARNQHCNGCASGWTFLPAGEMRQTSAREQRRGVTTMMVRDAMKQHALSRRATQVKGQNGDDGLSSQFG